MTGSLIVVGGGQASVSLVSKLRALGDDRPVTLISEEPLVPYQRPPLSKKYMMGEMDIERLFLRPERWYTENNIALRLGLCVNSIDRVTKTIETSSGERLKYDRLALTTGSSPRKLPKQILNAWNGIYSIRSVSDIDDMASEMLSKRSVLVVGGGYIGLEVAAVAAKRGLNVTVIEAASRILKRVAARETSDYFRNLHLNNGVRVVEGVGLVELIGKNRRFSSALISNGETIAADFIVSGIGIVPNDGLAAAAGLSVNNGIVVNSACGTSDPSIFAAGDCASFPKNGIWTRLESVQNAVDQGEAAAEALAGKAVKYEPHPWFWSDQYDVKLQIAGLNVGYDTTIIRSGKRTGGMSVWYYKGDMLLAVDAMNDASSFMIANRMIKASFSPRRCDIEDPSFDLKSLIIND